MSKSSSSSTTTHDGFVAIKCTALGNPELLLRMSSMIVELRQYGDDGGDGKIDDIDWINSTICTTPFNKKEQIQYHNMIQRLHDVAQHASESGVRLMIDAEQTYIQPAIDHLVLMLQRQYNDKMLTPNHPVIYSTYQCYLKDSYDRVMQDLYRAKKEQFHFGCKLVRGAYMVQERQRAKEMKYPDPIHNTIDDTHQNYNRLIYLLLQHNDDASFMVASHNAESVKKTVEWMKDFEIPSIHSPRKAFPFPGLYYCVLTNHCGD